MTTDQNAQPIAEPENNLSPQTTDPSAAEPASDQQPQQTAATTTAEPEKKPRDAQERIRELIAREKAALEYAEYYREKAMTGLKPPAPEAPKEEPAPKLADFKGDTEKWADAHAKWTETQIEKRAAAVVERKTAEHRDSTTKSALNQQWTERCEAFAEKTPDFFQVVGNPRLPITQTMTEVLQSSERGAELAYHLGTNPGEAARIARMSPAQQAAALGRLEAKLETPAKPQEKPQPQTTKAPEPPNPVGGGGVSRVDIESMTPQQYLDYKLKKRSAKR